MKLIITANSIPEFSQLSSTKKKEAWRRVSLNAKKKLGAFRSFISLFLLIFLMTGPAFYLLGQYPQFDHLGIKVIVGAIIGLTSSVLFSSYLYSISGDLIQAELKGMKKSKKRRGKKK